MTSKNSFWKLSIWNIKKRSWVLALCFFAWFFALPVATYFVTSAYAHDMKMYGEAIGYVQELTWNFYSIFHVVVTIVLAIFMPIQAFGWLNKRQKVDMYKSVPVKERTRFIYTHVNSLLIFAIPFAVCLIIANFITVCFGLFDFQYIVASCKIFITCILIYMSVYMLVLIAQLLTGNYVLAFFGGCFLLLVEPALRFICWLFMDCFFDTIYRGYATQISQNLMQTITSPIATGICDFISYRNTVMADSANSYIYYRFGMGVVSDSFRYEGQMLLQFAVYAVLAYLLYRKRASQTGGKNILFEKAVPVIKLAIIFVISLGIGYFTCSAGVGRDMEITYGFLGIVLSSVVLHIVLGAIIEGDFNSAFKRLIKTLSVSLAGCLLACCLFSIFAFDVFHFNSYLPKENELESFAFVRSDDYNSLMDYNSSFYPMPLSVDKMQITDADAKKVFLKVLKDAIERNEYTFESNVPEYVEKSAQDTLGLRDDFVYEDGGLLENVSVTYNLKNGKHIYRNYCLKHTDARKIYSAIYGLKEYKAIYNPLADADVMEKIKERDRKKEAKCISYDFENLSQGSNFENLSQDVLVALCEAAKEDIDERVYEDIVSGVPVARIAVGLFEDGVRNGETYNASAGGFSFVVYETDERMMKVLKENDLYKDLSIPLEAFNEITIYYNENEYGPGETIQHALTLSADDERVEAILGAAVPLDAQMYAIDFEMCLKEAYAIVVKPKKGNEVRYGIYTKDFPADLKDIMDDAEVTDSWMTQY